MIAEEVRVCEVNEHFPVVALMLKVSLHIQDFDQ
jgi:hypothetical protein